MVQLAANNKIGMRSTGQAFVESFSFQPDVALKRRCYWRGISSLELLMVIGDVVFPCSLFLSCITLRPFPRQVSAQMI